MTNELKIILDKNSPTYAQDLKNQLSEALKKLNESLSGNKAVGFNLATELSYIHSSLRANPAIAYLLSDEEIGVITKGFSIETSIVLASPKVKVTKAAATLSIDDI